MTKIYSSKQYKSGMTDKKHSKKTKEKQRQAALKQFKNGMPEETKKKIKEKHADFSGKNHPMYGRKQKQSSKNKIGLANSGKNNYQWKGNKYQDRVGRWSIWVEGIRYYNARYITEQYLKRKLTKKENIHHINGDCSDDRLENLYLFSTKGKHMKHHRLKNSLILKSNLISC